jgi:hypothetical protein
MGLIPRQRHAEGIDATVVAQEAATEREVVAAQEAVE